MAEGLKESVLSNPPRGRFKARPYYSATGDFLAFHWSREDFYAHRENDLLTIYLSMLTHKPVGCKIKGVNRVIMDKLATFFSSVAKTPPTLGSLVLASRALVKQDADHTESKYFAEVGEATRDVLLDIEELECVSV
jgi:hypothetical protein